ncbi:MAG: putative lipopolysaccharide heptosyltransferase III [Candidatus Omnitrophica bacterium]|nr:putative lipopolysaccharide heptosyltransferase III [Candidatus Omnitrophota bacterium]
MYKKILVIKLRHIGDVLLSTPVFKALKENFSQSYISALVNKGTEAVLENNPFIDEIITFDRNIKKKPIISRFTEEIKFLRKIHKKNFDTTIDLTGGDRAAIISFFSGAKVRVGIKSKGFIGKTLFYTHLFDVDGSRHVVLQNLEIIERMGLKINNPEIVLNVTDEEKKWAEKLVSNSNSHRKVIVHPTSRWFFKCWRDEYMAEIIKWFISKGYKVILTSSSEEKEIKKIHSILSYIDPSLNYTPSFLSVEESPPLINLAGKLTLRQLVAVCSVCDFYFGIDTAPMHIAAALGKPVIALFGPSGAFHWGPWDNEALGELYSKRNGIQRFGKNIVIQRDWNCIPCGQDGCEGSKISKCLFDIKPDEVIKILESIVANL